MITTPSVSNQSTVIEQGDPSKDTRAFRRALGQFATGVTVVTTRTGDQFAGMAVNSFSTVSLEPPLVSWSIRTESHNREVFTQGEHFAISVLAEDQVDVCSMFGRPRDDKFDLVPWTESMHGDPLLTNAIAHFECTVEATYPGGDHEIIIGRVQNYTRFEGAPLIFSQGQYGVAFDHPQLDGTSAADSGTAFDTETMFVSLLKTTERYLSDQFNEYREELELSVAAGRIINILDVSPATVQQLSEGALMGRTAIEDSLTNLLTRGLVSGDGEGPYDLTRAGKSLRATFLDSAQEFNQQLVKTIDPEDMEIARRVLLQLLTS